MESKSIGSQRKARKSVRSLFLTGKFKRLKFRGKLIITTVDKFL